MTHTPREGQPVARSIPEDYGAVPLGTVPPDDRDPVTAWLDRARCCGSPQMCGALCMDSERSQTEATVVRRLDEAERVVAELRDLANGYELGENVPVYRLHRVLRHDEEVRPGDSGR